MLQKLFCKGGLLTICMLGLEATAQPVVELLPYGNIDQWVVRIIKESAIIGGKVKYVYAVAPTDTVRGNEAYHNAGGSPWATSNVMARVAGVTKTNVSVFPEQREGGYCARLDTHLESVKVFGLIDITVLAAGSLFVGEVHEPIKSTKNPQKMLESGIPFTRKPTALAFDYKVRMSDRKQRIRATGFSRITDVEGVDYPEATLFLQKRWEDEAGNLYAKRIGTLVVRFEQSTDWHNQAIFPILYGDITANPAYQDDRMRLQVEERYAVNSKGESVPVKEVEWGGADEQPTHLVLQFASSHGGAYIGSPGNSLWIDNVGMVY
ncbi:MAG: PCMD domain-containing protein [Prevotellaceae bacterium]|nr:PCMD domain-containing protein [Prevotellaceae bacterium]